LAGYGLCTKNEVLLVNKFKKVVALDTIIFYPEHEEALKKLVENPKIERIPLKYDQLNHEWTLPKDYAIPEHANILIWPSSLPESFKDLTPELHEKLKTAQCWTEAGLRESISNQNLYNRIKDTDCILTCWTNIQDPVLDQLIKDGKTKAIITWTHEFEHRLNVEKTRKAGIYTNSVPDYGTYSVAELEFDFLMKLIEKNKKTEKRAETNEDIVIGTLNQLFRHYRKSDVNEKNTRRGSFSHQFHKLGMAQEHYSNLQSLDEVIPEKMLMGKNIGILGDANLGYLENILQNGFQANIHRASNISQNAEFYRFISDNEIVVYDSSIIDKVLEDKIKILKGGKAIDIQSLNHYEEQLRNKTLGIVGLGRIGSRVAEIAKTFGMKIQYTTPQKKDNTHEYTTLSNIMQTSNIISVNVPTHKVENLINNQEIIKIRNGTYLINTSDGNAIDQKALTERMQKNEIYAGLDVYKGLPTSQTLHLDNNYKGKIGNRLSNHVLTYRAGWKTQESIRTKTYKMLGHMIDALQK